MTFAAVPVWQAILLLAVVTALAVWIFRMQVRPPRVRVASLVIWQRVLDAPRERTWWERVRRAVSMVVTALIAAALGSAFAQPVSPTARTGGPRLLVLDSSWSMLARTAEGGSRWDRAVAAARAMAQPTGDAIALATTADGIVEGPTTDTALIGAALDRLRPGGRDGAWPRLDGAATTHFFGDGTIARGLDASVVVHSVYEPAANAAITAFGARPATSSDGSAEAYIELANHAAAQSIQLTITRNATVILDRTIAMGAHEVLHQAIPLNADGGARLRARIHAAGDALDIDDTAVAWLPMAEPVKVTVVSARPEALTHLLEQDASVQAVAIAPAAYRPLETDVWIFDGWTPPESPARPALYLDPPAAPYLGRVAADEVAPRWSDAQRHPVLDGVDPFTLDLPRARAFDGPDLQPIARSERGTPIVSIVDTTTMRAVVAGFSLVDSNITSTPAFPILIGNAVDWLAHPVSVPPQAPGSVTLPTGTARVTGPDGASMPITRAGDRALARLAGPGLYLVEGAGARSVIAVNAGAPELANLQRSSLPTPSSLSTASSRFAGQPWWLYAAALAFVLLTVEWWTWQRRITV